MIKNFNYELSNGLVTQVLLKRYDKTNKVVIVDMLDADGNVLANDQWLTYSNSSSSNAMIILTMKDLADVESFNG